MDIEEDNIIRHIPYIRAFYTELKAQRPSRNGVHSERSGNGDQPVKVEDMVCSAWRHAAGLTIRKDTSDIFRTPKVDFPSISVVVNASGGGSDIVAKQIPGRASRMSDGKDKAYVVDFIHEWDWHDDGRGKKKPGPMMASDLSRKRSYNELGFRQITVDRIEDLPFIK